MIHQKTSGVKIHLALILVSCLFGVNYVLSKLVLNTISTPAWCFIRVLFTAIFMYPVVLPSLRKQRPTGRQWLQMAYLGFFGVVINLICFFEGLSRTTATHAAIINTTIPIFVLLFTLLFRQEKLNAYRILGMILALAGVLTVLEIEKQHFDSVYFWGDILNLLNSASFSFYIVSSKKLNREISPLVVTFGMFATGTLGMAFYGGHDALAVPWKSLSLVVYLCMAFVVLGASVGTYSLNNWALSKTNSTMVALYNYFQPVVAGFLSRLVYHERVTLRMVIALLLVFTGVAVGSIFPSRRKHVRSSSG